MSAADVWFTLKASALLAFVIVVLYVLLCLVADWLDGRDD